MKTISLNLPETLVVRLEKEAREMGVTKSQLVRNSLEKSLNDESKGFENSCYELAHDLAGSVKGVPKDIATKPGYMGSFGR